MATEVRAQLAEHSLPGKVPSAFLLTEEVEGAGEGRIQRNSTV